MTISFLVAILGFADLGIGNHLLTPLAEEAAKTTMRPFVAQSQGRSYCCDHGDFFAAHAFIRWPEPLNVLR